jgi:hypothetical protein
MSGTTPLVSAGATTVAPAIMLSSAIPLNSLLGSSGLILAGKALVESTAAPARLCYQACCPNIS